MTSRPCDCLPGVDAAIISQRHPRRSRVPRLAPPMADMRRDNTSFELGWHALLLDHARAHAPR